MTKKILFNDEARKILEQGIDTLAKAVSLTLGPGGKNVLLERKFGAPQIINDGVTIAKEIELSDPIENIGVSLIRQAALKTNDVVGDGTTTATVLAYAIFKQGMKSIISGINPILMKKGIEKAIKFLVEKISEYSRPVKDLKDIVHIATISSGNDLEVGNMIAKAIEEVGREGIIYLEEGKLTKTYLEIAEGIRFDKGFISPYLILDKSTTEIIQNNPYLLLTDQKITLVKQELMPILEQVAKTGRALLIIAEDIDKEALATLVLNNIKGLINVAAVRAPGFGDRRKAFLDDLALLTGAQVISKDLGLGFESLSLDVMGSARKITIHKDHTTIITYPNKKLVELRCNQIRKQIEASNNNYEKEKLQERLSKLVGGVAIIKLGAFTEIEMKEKKLRLEDAINATKAAIEEGIVPGGGCTLVHLSQELDLWSNQYLSGEELIGALIVRNALCLPLSNIVKNIGANGPFVVEKVRQDNFAMGYDANRDSIVNMYLTGIIDPAKVTRLALQNAASIASMILTTECMIINENVMN